MRYVFLYYIAVSLLCNRPLELSAAQWSLPFENTTSFLFAPGIGACERQVVKYCKTYEASTGESVVCHNNFETINSACCSSCNFAEIKLHTFGNITQSEKSPWYQSLHLARIASGLYAKIRNVIIDPLEKTEVLLRPENQAWVEGQSTNGLTVRKYTFDFTTANIGQSADVAILSQQYDKHIERFAHSDMVLYGTSRGAATSSLFLATEYAVKPIKKIKAVVLEGCFDSIEHVVKERCPFLCKSAYMHSLLHSMVSKVFKGYRVDGLSPLHNVNALVHICNMYNIPILFVTSQVDSVVPFACTQVLCNALHKAGMRDMYLLVLQKSDHPWYMLDNEFDTRTYEAVVHAFYKKYNIAHDPTMAQAGASRLEQCRI